MQHNVKENHVPERIFAFAVPLGPAHPGLINEEKRKQEARRIIRSVMPSTTSLIGAGLDERIMSDGRLIWLAFDLVESPQLSLAFDRQKGKRTIQSSPIQRMIAELARLKDESETTTIRIGELEHLAQTFPCAFLLRHAENQKELPTPGVLSTPTAPPSVRTDAA